MISKFPEAYGSGHFNSDNDATEVGLDGHLWMMWNVSQADLKRAWVAVGLSTDRQESAWHKLDDCKRLYVLMRGYKIRRSFFSFPIWVGLVIFGIERDQVNIGWISANDITSLFNNFIFLFEGNVKARNNVEAVIGSH